MSTPENPFAFPFPEIRDHEGCGIREGSDGMSLRDWFAGQALIGFLACPKRFNATPDDCNLAGDCYAYADAMLAARATPTGKVR